MPPVSKSNSEWKHLSRVGKSNGTSLAAAKGNGRSTIDIKRPSFDAIGGPVVTLLLGEPAKPFVVHKDLLIQSSPYFRKALTGRFKESEGKIVLDDIDESASGVLKRWLYAQKLVKPQTLRDKHKIRVALMKKFNSINGDLEWEFVPFKKFDATAMGLGHDSDVQEQFYLRGRFEALDMKLENFWNWDDLVDVFIMADKYDFPHLRDDIIKQWQWQAANYRSHCNIRTVARAFENLPEDSPLLILIADHWGYLWNPIPKDANEVSKIAPQAFLAALTMFQGTHKGSRYDQITPLFQQSPCEMHEHPGVDKSCNGFKGYSKDGTTLIRAVWKKDEYMPNEESESEGEEDEENGDTAKGDGDDDDDSHGLKTIVVDE